MTKVHRSVWLVFSHFDVEHMSSWLHMRRKRAAGFCFVRPDTELSSAHASTPAPFAFFRLLLFECKCGVNKGFLIAAEPSLPAVILGVNAPLRYFSCRLAKMGLVA